jgi:hypothetical protein
MEESSYRETGTLDDPSSSPFLPTPRVEDKKHDQRINSPAKHSFASGPELASLEMNNHEETIEDGETIYHDPEENYNMGSSTTSGRAGYDGMDDTAFSTFSAVPNMDMTRFAHNGQFQEGDRRSSPSKQLQAESKYSLYHDTVSFHFVSGQTQLMRIDNDTESAKCCAHTENSKTISRRLSITNTTS